MLLETRKVSCPLNPRCVYDDVESGVGRRAATAGTCPHTAVIRVVLADRPGGSERSPFLHKPSVYKECG